MRAWTLVYDTDIWACTCADRDQRRARHEICQGSRVPFTGRQFIRPYMPEQHRAFYESLEYAFIGIRGQDGRPCAFCVAGEKGFIRSPSPTELVVDLHHGMDTGEGQWVLESLHSIPSLMPCARKGGMSYTLPTCAGAAVGSSVGLLGLEMDTRRRNRANGIIVRAEPKRLHVHVMESFGNCPKYIQVRPEFPHSHAALCTGFPDSMCFLQQCCSGACIVFTAQGRGTWEEARF